MQEDSKEERQPDERVVGDKEESSGKAEKEGKRWKTLVGQKWRPEEEEGKPKVRYQGRNQKKMGKVKRGEQESTRRGVGEEEAQGIKPQKDKEEGT